MILINGFLRYLILVIVFWAFFAIEGGHASILIFDTLVLEQYMLFFICMAFYMGTLNPKTKEQVRQVRFAGRSGLILAIVVPILGALVHYLVHILNMNALGVFLSTLVICLLNAPLIYFSFFHWASGPLAFEGLPVTQKLIHLRREQGVRGAIKVGLSYLFYSVGVLVVAGFVIVPAGMYLESLDPKRKISDEIYWEGRKIVSEKLDQIEKKYVEENCKLMTDSEKQKMKDKLSREQDEADKEKLYKVYHEKD